MSWKLFGQKKQNPKADYQDLLRGWPATKKIKDPDNVGITGFQVTARYLTPGAVQVATGLWALLIFVVILDMMNLNSRVKVPDFTFWMVIGLAIFGFGSWVFFRRVLSWKLVVNLFSDRIVVKGRKDLPVFKDELEPVFSVKEHDKSEAEKLEWQRNPKKRRYYSKSGYVAVEYHYQVYYLACVYPEKKASLLHGRLEAIQKGFKNNLY